MQTPDKTPHTPQGRRDAVLLGLMLTLRLRCGEVAGLTLSNVDVTSGELRFYRPKVDIVRTHDWTSLARAKCRL